jgi:hypothetical protein
MGALTSLECGHAFRPTANGLTLTGLFPAVVRHSEGLVSGTVAFEGEGESRQAVMSGVADLFLVRDGSIATLPLPHDMVGVSMTVAAGTVVRVPAIGSLIPCDSADSEGALLEPGTYENYARILLNYDDDGSQVECFGGPWPVEIRE